jgi:hypothetical protein
MTRKIVLAVLASALFLGLFGCATYPAPVIKNGTCANFEYQYTADIPQGWQAYDKFPKDMEIAMPYDFRKMVNLVMVNKAERSLIVLGSEKRRQDFAKFINVPESKWQEITKNLEKSIKSNAEVTRYDAHLNSQNVAATSRNHEASPAAFKPKALFGFQVDMATTMEDTTVGLEWFIYPCHGGILCQTFVMIGGPQKTIKNSLPEFEAVIDSLTMQDVKQE